MALGTINSSVYEFDRLEKHALIFFGTVRAEKGFLQWETITSLSGYASLSLPALFLEIHF